jgi:hypothetical protein
MPRAFAANTPKRLCLLALEMVNALFLILISLSPIASLIKQFSELTILNFSLEYSIFIALSLSSLALVAHIDCSLSSLALLAYYHHSLSSLALVAHIDCSLSSLALLAYYHHSLSSLALFTPMRIAATINQRVCGAVDLLTVST